MFKRVMITSRNNPKIKNIVRLSKAAERQQQNLFVVEGFREIDRALRSAYEAVQFYYSPDLCKPDKINELLNRLPQCCDQEAISPEVFEKIAYREGSDGFVAVFQLKQHRLADFNPSDKSLILVVESVEKPGNLGAVIRTADAAGLDAVIVCDPRTDIYNPNTIRSSIGCVFTVPIYTSTTAEVIQWLDKHRILSYATSLEASIPYTTADFTQASAIIMGTEATGLTDAWLKAANHRIIIPMHGIADSLNISTSAAIVVFEAIRQRNST